MMRTRGEKWHEVVLRMLMRMLMPTTCPRLSVALLALLVLLARLVLLAAGAAVRRERCR